MFEGKIMAGKKINFISKYLKKRMDSEADIQTRKCTKGSSINTVYKKREISMSNNTKTNSYFNLKTL